MSCCLASLTPKNNTIHNFHCRVKKNNTIPKFHCLFQFTNLITLERLHTRWIPHYGELVKGCVLLLATSALYRISGYPWSIMDCGPDNNGISYRI